MSDPTPAVSRLVKRAEFQSYMNVAASGSTASYELIGEGFTSLSESKNPKEYSRQYVHEITERTDVVGYAPSIAYSVDAHTNNSVITKIMAVTDQELTGADAQVDIVSVNVFAGSETSAPAFKRKYNIIPDNKGDGTDALIYTGTLRAAGDVESGGTFNVTTKTYTAPSP